MNNYDKNISGNYVLFKSQPEIREVKNISNDEKLVSLIKKKRFSRRLVSLVLAGTLFSSGVVIGKNIDKIKVSMDDDFLNPVQTELNEDSLALENLCEKTGKNSSLIYDEFLKYCNVMENEYGIRLNPSKEEYIRFINNYDSCIKELEQVSIKKGVR